ncbi:MAG TPA: amidase [Marmoricola sp.]|nr:amidase [Marmoricola sp.]
MPDPTETATGAAAALAAGELSSAELTDEVLDRIEDTEPALHAWFTVTAELARDQARALDASSARGLLHGLPIGVKDLIDTAGVRTTYGSPRYVDHVPTTDAAVVAALRRAGAVLLGKHATHELAWGGRTDSAFFGPTHNPYRLGHIPGGSSGGSAASVVAGSCLGAIGSDTAGSVRIPAALSGCVGVKPSRGRISCEGVLPLAPSLDHIGVLARTVDDAALLLDAVAAPTSVAAPDQLRFGWLRGWFEAVLDPGVRTVLEQVRTSLEDEGAVVHDIEVPDQPLMPAAVLTRILAEAGEFHRAAFEDDPSSFGADIAELMRGTPPTPDQLAGCSAATQRLGRHLLGALASCDVLVSATMPITAPRIGARTVGVAGQEWRVELLLTRLTSIYNATGLPAASVPVGLAGGLPVGLQLGGAFGHDAAVLDAARFVEQLCAPLPAPRLPGASRAGAGRPAWT